MASVADVHGAPSESGTRPVTTNGTETREKKRRRRTRPHEVDILMSAYVQNAFPNEKTRERLAQAVGMTQRAVSVWFQNRRQAEKKRSQRFGGCGAGVTAYGVHRMPVQTLDLAHLHGLRDLHELVGPLPGAPRQGSLQRARSSPCISLTTNAQGHAQLGPSEAPQEAPCDSAIWQRMESSSAVNSSSDVEEPDARASQDEDEEEMTLRRLAQRRARKRDALDASDARRMIQTQVQARRPAAPRGFKRQASLSLEFAAERGPSPENAIKPLRRTESMPVRAPLHPIQPVSVPVPRPVPMPRSVPVARPAPPLDAARVPDQENALRVPSVRPISAFRRVASAGARLPRECALWPRTPTVPVTRRESSARSDPRAMLAPPPLKAEEHDDSGFFEEESHSSPETAVSAPAVPTPHITEHDRQAVELLLGLGSIPAGRT